jgi:hypothetical protein
MHSFGSENLSGSVNYRLDSADRQIQTADARNLAGGHLLKKIHLRDENIALGVNAGNCFA